VKAFLTTRVGDVFFLVGVFVLYGIFGTVDYQVILSPGALATLRQMGMVPGTSFPIAAVIALLVFGGAVGKSAQFPLHVWLPDAMEGPTPVSALIHAATMVAAGVFLVARMYPLFSVYSVAAPSDVTGPMFIVATIGALTAIGAATVGVAQFDIKRVLAYSTISQLGYMIMALGIGAYVAAVFHLITHAFFKSLLFLGSGSVIHGVEHGHHHATEHGELASHTEVVGGYQPAKGWVADVKDAPQDMRNMGGLRERMPFTFVTFLIGALALTGIPVFAGFWSKDEILAEAFHAGVDGRLPIAAIVWLLGTLGAFLTAFYMARQVCMVFGGKPRTEAAQHAPESEPAMIYPLLVLAVFATLLGFAGVSRSFPVIGPLLKNPVHEFVGTLTGSGATLEALAFNPLPALISVAVALTGWAAGWWLYGRDPEAGRAQDPLQQLGAIWTTLNRKYYVDELYGATVIPATKWLSRGCATFDQRVVDGAVNGAGRVGRSFSRVSGWIDNRIVDGAVNLVALVNVELSRGLRLIQTGRVQQYILIVFLGLLFLVGVFIF
jgi:NADH-quinone oxidoreductase subunit L